MQNKGAIKALAIIFGLIFLYQLSFTVVTKVVENKAAKFTQGDADKEKHYLDSMNNVQVYNLLVKKYTYRDAKEREINLGLDLRGGMNVTMEITVKDIVNALAGDAANNPTFQQAIQNATEQQIREGGGDFVTLFGKEFEKIDPNASLAEIFVNEFSNKGIDNNSSNSDVLKVLKKECDDAVDRAYQILRTRIDRFGVAQPNIQKLEGSGQIMIELPGVKDPERVEKLLQGTAQLEFWETYNFNEVFQDFIEAERVIAKSKGENPDNVEEEVKNLVDIEEEAPVLTDFDEEQIVEEQEGEEEEVADEEMTEDNADEEVDLTAQNNEESEAVSQSKSYLFGLLQPNVDGNGSPYASACIGRALEKDTAAINEMLNIAFQENVFKPDMKLAWTVKPEKFGEGNNQVELLELVALKLSKGDKCALAGEAVSDARQDYDQNNQVEVSLAMNREGAKEWKRITGENIDRQIAIVLDNYVYSYPVVRNEISGGRSSISGGNMTIEEAQDLANILKAGKLPARATILAKEVIGPSLGKESVNKGMWSMVIAFILVLVYMVFFYKKSGMVANIALIVNVFFLFGVLACLGSVLTLPGIAGIVLTLGMAVDSNVIIFERIKEELRGGKGLRPAIDAGYKNAYSAIIDGNVTTLITGIVLIVLGAGPVHSFAVTLCIGILTSLFTSIFITRLIFTRMLEKEKDITFTTKLTENFLKDTHFDFIKFRKTAFIIACVMLVISAGSLAIKGLNRGIDFTGGRNYVIQFDDPSINVETVRDALTKANIDKASIHSALEMSDNNAVEDWSTPEVKTFGTKGQLKITTNFLIDNKKHNKHVEDSIIQCILYDNLKGLYKTDMTMDQFQFSKNGEEKTVGIIQTQEVSGTIARDVTRKSVWAIIVSLVLMFAYIAIRFRKWQYGLSALAALAHDTIIMLGMYSLFFNILPFTMEVDQAFIAAVLTIIGYSINATVVIFDRVRENTNLHPKATWRENINNAVNSTLTRSFNTSGSTFVVLLAIFIFGGDTIRGFIFSLLVGILAGTFSSIFLSSSIAYNLLKGHKQDQALAEAEDKNNKKK